MFYREQKCEKLLLCNSPTLVGERAAKSSVLLPPTKQVTANSRHLHMQVYVKPSSPIIQTLNSPWNILAGTHLERQ